MSNHVLVKVWVLVAAVVARRQLVLIDCDCDWRELGATVWPLVLSRSRSLKHLKQEGDIGS